MHYENPEGCAQVRNKQSYTPEQGESTELPHEIKSMGGIPALQWIFNFAIPVVLVAAFGPLILERKRGGAFIAFVSSVWLLNAIMLMFLLEPSAITSQNLRKFPKAFISDFFATATSYCIPVLIAALLIWILRCFRANRGIQAVVSLFAGLLACNQVFLGTLAFITFTFFGVLFEVM